jgi:hypothetical protein
MNLRRERGARHLVGRQAWALVGLLGMGVAACDTANQQGPTTPKHEATAAVEITSQAIVGFRGAVSDGDVLATLKESGARARAVFMAAGEFSGTHRNNAGMSPEEAVRDARKEAITFFENALASNAARLTALANRSSDADIRQQADLRDRAEGWLTVRASLEKSLAEVKNGAPVIYSLEVEGNPRVLDALRRDARLASVNAGEFVDGKKRLQRTATNPAEVVRAQAVKRTMSLDTILSSLAPFRGGDPTKIRAGMRPVQGPQEVLR